MSSNVKLSWKIFWSNITPWFCSSEKKIACAGFIGAICLSLSYVGLSVVLNLWSKNFFDAIESKKLDLFLHQVLLFIPIVILIVSNFCALNYVTQWLSFRWRMWMTSVMQNDWLDNKRFYKLSNNPEYLDNPDQRITQDITSICYGSLSLFMNFFKSAVNFITFAVMLWGVSSNISVPYKGEFIVIPGLLLWAALLYSLSGIFITFKIGKPLIDLDRLQEKYEADFRRRLLRVIERSEEVATISGENFEINRLKEAFSSITQNYYTILKYNIYINLFQNFFGNGSMFVPLFVVSPAYFAGMITMGVLMQVRGIFSEVESSLSTIAMSYVNIASLIASMQRIVDFKANMKQVDLLSNLQRSNIEDGIHISDLQIKIPEREILNIPEISIGKGDKIAIMAPSGYGKTSLLRCVAGISSLYAVNNNTRCEIPNDTMFISQKPYLPIGTLRQCITYPSEASAFSNTEIQDAMKAANLGHLINNLDMSENYQQTLSVGEQQRVNFARIFLHKPQWLVLDEPTSQMNLELVENMCNMLHSLLPQTGVLAFTHHKLPNFKVIPI